MCVARPAGVVARQIPRGLPETHWRFTEQARAFIPRAVAVELPRGRVIGPHGAIITADGSLVDELSPFHGTTDPREHPLFLHPFPGPPLRVAGRLGVLASRGDANYFHFLVESLPRLGVLEQCPEIAFPTRWYAPARTSFQRELISAMGIAPEQVIDSTRVLHVEAECLVVPGLPDPNVQIPKSVVTFLRSHLLPEGVGRVPGRRLYVTRGNQRHSRIVTNGGEVFALLAERGFVEIDPGTLSVTEQVRAFAEAEVIVSPHGAALGNLAFASPGSMVVEFFSPDYVLVSSWILAENVPGLDYRYLVGEGRPRAGRERVMAGTASDITVDLSKLARLLDE